MLCTLSHWLIDRKDTNQFVEAQCFLLYGFDFPDSIKVELFFFFFFEETIILIKTREHENSIWSFLNRFIIYYITKVPLQKSLTFIIVAWGYKDWNSIEVEHWYFLDGQKLEKYLSLARHLIDKVMHHIYFFCSCSTCHPHTFIYRDALELDKLVLVISIAMREFGMKKLGLQMKCRAWLRNFVFCLCSFI